MVRLAVQDCAEVMQGSTHQALLVADAERLRRLVGLVVSMSQLAIEACSTAQSSTAA